MRAFPAAGNLPARKLLAPLATHIFEVEKNDGIPAVQLMGHTLTNMATSDGTAYFHRYTVQPVSGAPVWMFKPDNLTIPENKTVRLTELGAVFFNGAPKKAKLPTAMASLAWEIQLDKVPPPSFNLLKPKFYLMGKLTMRKGMWYLIASPPQGIAGGGEGGGGAPPANGP